MSSPAPLYFILQAGVHIFDELPSINTIRTEYMLVSNRALQVFLLYLISLVSLIRVIIWGYLVARLTLKMLVSIIFYMRANSMYNYIYYVILKFVLDSLYITLICKCGF